jgi:hypothetical protein
MLNKVSTAALTRVREKSSRGARDVSLGRQFTSRPTGGIHDGVMER